VKRSGFGLVLLAFVGAVFAQQPAYDLLLKNGRVVDGSGAPWFVADVAVRGDTIVAIGRDLGGSARRSIDVRGAVIAPGFIDLHTHARRGILRVPTADNYVRQGVTTLVEGPDGSSPLPLRPFLDEVAAAKPAPNFASFVGQGSIREKVVGLADRKATAAEIETMKDLVRSGMRDGAFGLSSGLFYVPGAFTPTEEVIALAKVAGGLGGIYISHMRNEAKGVLDSVLETIRIGDEGGLPTQITHHKIIGVGNWGKSQETLAALDAARARGVDASIDQYPYTASSTSLQALLPAWALEGGSAEVVKRLADPATRGRIRATVVERRSQERPDRLVRPRALAGRQAARRDHALARPRGHPGERRRDRARDRREGRRVGDLPRDRRSRPGPDPETPGHDDRI
jgi:N-acyl-D-amino-acid deacylase